MHFIAWIFRVIYELIADLLISIVGHHRGEQSFKRREKTYQPFRDFIYKAFGYRIKTRTYKEQLSKTDHSLTYKVVTLVLAILAILWIRYSVIEPYKIPSGSMIPTLQIGDHIFVNKLTYGLRIPFIGEVTRWNEPKRGEVIVFVPPLDNGKVYVKRLIGVPGDKIRVEDDKLYINDELIVKTEEQFYPVMKDVDDNPNNSNPYIPDNFNLYTEDLIGIKHYVAQLKDRESPYNNHFSMEVVVPENAYFFMGDNRDNSEDSRVWGFASRDAVRGRAMFIWLSLNWSKAFTPSWMRFSRFGKVVR
ncbi:MAG: signal peptidase I [Proteobacteria bacterium]|nr:signal peptidase I [Pseudomonadota bacterium]